MIRQEMQRKSGITGIGITTEENTAEYESITGNAL